MQLNDSVKVPLLERKIAYKTISGKKYVYYTIACYRNERGKPTSDRVSIGRLDEKTGLLISNRNYYEVYLKHTPPVQGGIRNYGVYYAFSHICEELGVTKNIEKTLSGQLQGHINTVTIYVDARQYNVLS